MLFVNYQIKVCNKVNHAVGNKIHIIHNKLRVARQIIIMLIISLKLEVLIGTTTMIYIKTSTLTIMAMSIIISININGKLVLKVQQI
jgi:hypothetical protein